MKKNTKILGMGSAIVIAVLILLTAFTSAFPAEQRLVPTGDIDVTANPVIDKDCECDIVVCDYIVPGAAEIQSKPYYFDRVCGRDNTSGEYAARLEALTAYCEEGTTPGDWYGGEGLSGFGLPIINAILVCFGAAVAGAGVGIIATALIVTSVALGMALLDAIQAAGITVEWLVFAVAQMFADCVEFFSG